MWTLCENLQLKVEDSKGYIFRKTDVICEQGGTQVNSVHSHFEVRLRGYSSIFRSKVSINEGKHGG